MLRHASPRAQSLAVRRRKLVEQLSGLGPVLRVSYAKGKTRQVYVPKDLQPLAQKWVRNYHQAMKVLEEISSINLELIRLKEPTDE